MKKRSLKQERKVASELGGYRRAGSGNQAGYPGDVVLSRVLVECKTTEKDSFRVTSGVLEKIKQEAVTVGKDYALVLEFAGKSVVVIDFEFFKELLDGTL